MSSDPQRKPRRPFWRKLRIAFRRFRITVLFSLFVLVCAGVYLNQVGLPDFIKKPLLENLRSHGVDLEFSRLRLRGHRGIVADNVRLVGTDNPAIPHFSAQSADVKLNYHALARFELDIQGVTLRKGTVRWSLNSTNEPDRQLVITNVMADLRFLAGDHWSLDRLQAEYLGAQFRVTGQITNASALRQQLTFRKRDPQPAEDFIVSLRRFHDRLEQITFTQPPKFQLSFHGDGTDLRSFGGDFTIDAPGAITPWGELHAALLVARLHSVADGPIDTEISITADRALTRWGALNNLECDARATHVTTNDLQCQATLRATRPRSEWAGADSLEVTAAWTHGLNAAMPREGDLQLLATGVESPQVHADSVSLRGKFRPAMHSLAADPALGAWSQILPYALDLTCHLTNALASELQVDLLAATAIWEAPRLVLTNVQGRVADGEAALDATLDVLTRQLAFDGRANFDFHRLNPVLTEKSREWINHFAWEQPPSVQMRGALTLPAWTNRQPDWRGEVQPSIVLDGAASLTNGSYRGISALAAGTHLNYSNRVWRLPDLNILRPEGTLDVDLKSDEISHDYVVKLRGLLDPRALESQLDENGRRGLSYFEFTNAPWIDGEIRGRWYERERIWAKADVAWTNFSYRAQHADRLVASLEYTNRILQVFHPRVDRGQQRATADGLLFDFAAHLAYLTNGFSNTDPMAIAKVIGPKVAAAVEPYQFLEPPVARVEGVIPLKGERDADLHFDLAGGPFHWMKFNIPHIAGQVHWANESVTLTNVVASFYGGEGRGNAWFDVSERGSTPFHFSLTATKTDLHALMSDLRSPTNHLEGTLSGNLTITSANTTNWQTWNGYGQAKLRDGLIWDTPIFGVMSSMMNTIVPGIGNSRASEAGGRFTITNSVIHTRDLDIRASAMRLQYEGTVDFETHVNARVQAELLRDTWFVGKLVSTALWPVSKLFEYKVTGTLADPKTEPVYFIPKLFLVPLHPIESLKGILLESPTTTNAPPSP